MIITEKFPGVFLVDGKLATVNLTPGKRFFDEALLREGGKEYRLWDPNRSKAGAAIAKSIKLFPITKDSKILYLGAAHGFTPSFLSDIVGENGIIYAVEFSDRCFTDLLPVCEKRKNIAPILADARLPDQYSWIEKVDAVYQDIAQPDATEIAIRNCKRFLKKGGYLLLTIKSRSVDVTKNPRKLIEEEIEKLRAAGFVIDDWKMLDPFERDHGFIVAMMK
ncbi:MAG: fibrillarin-like rRNA/tRNA 2'-O-methyltransferase [Candidatus Aenigmatarchaeota archaeon]